MPGATGTQWTLFDQWWRAYPRKIGRQAAWEAWQRIRPVPDGALVARMLETLAWQRRDPQWLKDGGQWIPWPANYLKGRRWEDEPFEPQSSMALHQPQAGRPRTRSEAASQQTAEAVERILARRRSRPP